MEIKGIVLILIGAGITSALQFLNTVLTKKSERNLKHSDHLKLLASEIEDLTRHCIVSHQVLNAMDLEKGRPSGFHFEKMKIMESSILFSADTFLFIDSKYTRHLNRLKLEIRNINIEIDYVLKYQQKPNIDIQKLKEYIDYLNSKMEFSIDNLPRRLSELINIDRTFRNRIKVYKEESEGRPKTIIYE